MHTQSLDAAAHQLRVRAAASPSSEAALLATASSDLSETQTRCLQPGLDWH